MPGALNGGDSLDGEGQIGPLGNEADLICSFHARFERIHRAIHLRIIEGADVKIKFFKRLGRHAGVLCHGGIGIAQHHPFCFF